MPEVATFRIDDTQSFAPLGSTTLTLPEQEGLRTVRFDAERAYAITYNQTDPLFAIDLSNPAEPTQRGELEMPGFMFHLIPYGERVIRLGIDRTDSQGSLNVSLFDVSDMDSPRMLQRVSFAGSNFWEDYAILNGELPEDQDRIQKAFRVFDDGLVAVPFSSGAGCGDTTSGIELIRWRNDTLEEAALLPLPGNPRRAFENQGQLIGVSDSNVRAYSLTELDPPQPTADLIIGSCVPSSNIYSPEFGEYYDDDSEGYYCTVGPVGAHSSGEFGSLLATGAIAIALQRRRRGQGAPSRTKPPEAH